MSTQVNPLTHLLTVNRMPSQVLGIFLPLMIDDPKPQAVREAGKIIELGDAPILAAVKSQKAENMMTVLKDCFGRKAASQ